MMAKWVIFRETKDNVKENSGKNRQNALNKDSIRFSVEIYSNFISKNFVKATHLLNKSLKS